jgi:outer membrane biogenesis lipoprotein LolB
MLCLTKRMIRVRSILLLLPVVVLVAGCSSDATVPAAQNVDASGQPVSSVPWNKPESWETTGQLGGMGAGGQ